MPHNTTEFQRAGYGHASRHLHLGLAGALED
jgi:hypothetical protein